MGVPSPVREAMKYDLKFLLDMKESIDRTGMYMPNHYWDVYKELKAKYPQVDTGFADKNIRAFIKLEYPTAEEVQ